MFLQFGEGGGALIGKYATVQHLERRGHILLFRANFNSNLKKAAFLIVD